MRGGRAIVGKRCHIGAGAVLAGVVEPASATPVVIEDDVMIGANAVVIEGCRVGKGAVVAAGAVVSALNHTFTGVFFSDSEMKRMIASAFISIVMQLCMAVMAVQVPVPGKSASTPFGAVPLRVIMM